MTPKTLSSATGSSTGLTREPRTAAASTEGHSRRFQSADYWRAYFSHPAYDFAEAVIRLRRKCGMSQEELGEKIGSHQSAIARLESGEGNPRLTTLVELAAGLDACVRVQLVPFEELSSQLHSQPWFFTKATQRCEVVPFNIVASDPLAGARVFTAVGEGQLETVVLNHDKSDTMANNNFALAG